VGGQYVNEKASEGATLIAVNWKYKNISDEQFNNDKVALANSIIKTEKSNNY
jgi:hypothetical protein